MTENYHAPAEDYARFFDIEGFDVSQVDVSRDYPSSDSVGIQGTSESGSFFLAFTKGCTPPGREDEFEPQTLYLDDVNVYSGIEGQGTGTQVMKSLVELARQNGFNAVRSHYINPAMVTITEKLAKEGLIGKPVYEAHFTEEFRVEPTSEYMLANPDSFDSVDRALKSSGTDLAGALCVFSV